MALSTRLKKVLRLCQSSDVWRFTRIYGVYFLPIVFLGYITLESYQIDFRSMYLAGKSALLGLDPYVNYVGVRADFYGPINSESQTYSGFRYPPLAALVFSPLGALPYQNAKVLFTLIVLVFAVLLSFHFVRRSQFAMPETAVLFVMVSFPLIATVERGQIDILIVYLCLISYSLLHRRSQSVAAFLLAFAGMLKLFPFVLLIFYSDRKQWQFVGKTLLSAAVLFILPYPLLDPGSYTNFFKRTLPGYFGQIEAGLSTSLQGQGVIDGIVHSVDSTNLIAAHSFSSGEMNPWMASNTVGAIFCGLLLTGLLLIATRQTESNFQYYAFLNVINLFNPVSWIMGLVWYIPLFFYLSPLVSRWGRFLLLAPLFSPPGLNANAVLAYILSIVFALSFRIPHWGSILYQPDAQPTDHSRFHSGKSYFV
ncbi:hypothetical protein S7335_1855 [Synechococcus sp. PCC 7335]|uniref:glycosyltransferase family 87 protein n=1 Tax=Synechococcus sp. (strain ATCC 29403 / PCC 7335) TaxID=91464 RepID=UPI00017EE45B|nr:glycosyltransferase family 87 protein [Synechococcus sp. PCC 7335]EDX84158.1 hypothetical protein S7335_1855 [Synechococcus sp. PCC 7335]